MNLLTPAELAEIRAAIRDVTDTFARTPVTYLLSLGSIDRFNEDRDKTGNEDFETIELEGLVEFTEHRGDYMKRSEQGSEEKKLAKILFNYDVLEAAGLTTADLGLRFNVEKDYFYTQGVRYRVVYADLDGPMEPKNLLAVVIGEVDVKKA